MYDKKRGKFMTNLYTAPNRSRHEIYDIRSYQKKNMETAVKSKLAKEISENCSGRLFLVVKQMTTDLTQICTLILKEMK